MAQSKPSATKPKRAGFTGKSEHRGLNNVNRSAYFARREASKVLRSALQGDARRRAACSIKSLVYGPSVRNKKATFALVCQTLKHLRIIKEVLESGNILNSKWKKQEELMYIMTYDILFGKETSLAGGDAEKFLMRRKDALQTALAKLLVSKKVKHVDDLVSLYQPPDILKPCYVRVNTLKGDVDSSIHQLSKQFRVERDAVVPNLLILPPNTDLHNHPLVLDGSVFVQGRASSMVAAALDPKPGWQVLDACAAPGNKTVHLAALMNGKGKILACELNKDRIKRLEDTVRLSGARKHNVCLSTLTMLVDIEVFHGDFLNLDPQDPSFSQIRAILLDPSCSGSGTAAQRLDHLLPSHSIHDVDTERLNKLAAFQRRALTHALSFPGVEKVIYSTCSVNQTENEDVVSAVLPLASSLGFELSTPFPLWNCRGLPVIEGSEHLLRTDPAQHKEGFFIALFVKKCSSTKTSEVDSVSDVKSGGIKRKRSAPLLWNKMWRISSFAWQTRRKLRHEL
ncbi:25S rRNA (cytosine-C(5))-methyltransferase NSUN5 [Linum perenne]